MATKARAIPLVLVSVYEVGVRLKQSLLLLGANESPSAGGVAAVRQALTLLRVAFARLLASEPLAGWRTKVEATLGGAEQLAGVLVDGQPLEEFIQGLGLEGILQQGAGHDGQRGACGETLEEGLEQHAGGLWMARATTQRQTTGSGRGRGCRAHQQRGQPHECSVSFAANGC